MGNCIFFYPYPAPGEVRVESGLLGPGGKSSWDPGEGSWGAT